ncbi:MAG: glycosyltransferase family 9 protein [Burkholderiaceae bacterium]|nr:glycosyltransferase family 9 protein [Burkholderiaceae bacterium]
MRTSAIGDVVFASPLAAALRRTRPDAWIAWVVEPGIDALVRADPAIDECIVWPKTQWSALLRSGRWLALAREIRRFRAVLRERRFDLALDLHGLFKSAFLAWLSGAPRRVGLGAREGSSRLVTEVVPRGGDRARISSEYLYLARHLQLDTGDFLPRLRVAPQVEASARAMLAGNDLVPGGYAVFAAFTTRSQKHWFDDAWRDLSKRLHAQTGLVPLLLGGAADRAAAAALVRDAPEIVNLVGRTDLAQAAALVRDAAAVVGVDTGLTHMGIAFAVPTVALFGSTCPYTITGRENAHVVWRGLPCSPCHRAPTCGGRFDCMREITAERVASELALVLACAPAEERNRETVR